MWEGKSTGNQLHGRKHDATEWYDVVLEIDEYNIWGLLLSGTSKVVTWLGGRRARKEWCRHPEPTVDQIYSTSLAAYCYVYDTTALFPRLSGPGVANDDHCGKINFLRRGPRLLAAWAGSFFTIKPDPLIPALRDSPYLLFHRSPDK